MGARIAGNPHAACDVEGTRNVARSKGLPARQSSTLPRRAWGWDSPALLDYLRAYETVSEARSSIGRYLGFYNGRRPHSSLDGATPDQAYFNPQPIRLAA